MAVFLRLRLGRRFEKISLGVIGLGSSAESEELGWVGVTGGWIGGSHAVGDASPNTGLRWLASTRLFTAAFRIGSVGHTANNMT